MNDENKKYGVAIVGLGEYALNSLIPALKETKHCYLTSIVSDEEDTVKEVAKKNNLPSKNIYTYENFDEIISNDDVQIVYIVVPNSLHRNFTIRAAKAGKHVICEKPMATTVEDCDAMIKACKDAGVTLSIGYRLHFEPFNRKIMELGTSKAYGEIKNLVAQNGLSEIDGWRLDRKLAGGGALMDVGVYCIQAVCYTTGREPLSVKAQKGKTNDQEKFKEVEESISWQMQMPDGLIAECECSYTKEMNLLRAEAEKGWFELSPAFAYAGIKGKTSEGDMSFENNNQQAAELDGIAVAIKNGKPSPVPGEMGKRDLKIIKAIYASMENNEWVNVE